VTADENRRIRLPSTYVRIDTSFDTHDDAGMTRVKRTYNLPEQTIRTVRELSDRYGLDRSQDGVVELAVEELERQLRDAHESQVWAAAAQDPEFDREAAAIEKAYRAADAETWPK